MGLGLYNNVAWAEAYLSTSWHRDPSSRFATTNMGRNLGALPILAEGGAGSPSSTMWRGPRPTSTPSAILIHPAVWPQYTWAENWGAGLRPLFGEEELGLHLTQCCLGRSSPLYQMASWSMQPFVHNRHMGRKLGGSAPFLGREVMGAHLTHSRLRRGVPPYQVAP